MIELYRNQEGCNDHGCIFQDNSKGIHTNDGCRCAKELGRTAEGFKAVELIKFLRQQVVAAYRERMDAVKEYRKL